MLVNSLGKELYTQYDLHVIKSETELIKIRTELYKAKTERIKTYINLVKFVVSSTIIFGLYFILNNAQYIEVLKQYLKSLLD